MASAAAAAAVAGMTAEVAGMTAEVAAAATAVVTAAEGEVAPAETLPAFVSSETGALARRARMMIEFRRPLRSVPLKRFECKFYLKKPEPLTLVPVNQNIAPQALTRESP
jgi:hypothetical protein